MQQTNEEKRKIRADHVAKEHRIQRNAGRKLRCIKCGESGRGGLTQVLIAGKKSGRYICINEEQCTLRSIQKKELLSTAKEVPVEEKAK